MSAQRGSRSWRPGRLAGTLSFMLMAAFAAAGHAQETGQITGVVSDISSGAPLGEVQVFIEGEQLGALSRQNGRYLILNVPPGTYLVNAVRLGLAPVSREVEVLPGQTVEADFAMETQALGLDEIVVTGTAGAARRREVGNSINQINVAELSYEPTQVSDMLLSSAPGIEVTMAGGEVGQGSAIRLRGVNSSEMSADPIIYIDGVRMRSSALPQAATPDYRSGRGANNTPSALDMLNPNDIERIEVIKGSAATTLYGTEASAGVIQIFTKRGAQGAPVWTVETQQGTMWSQPFGANGVDYLHMDPWICTGFLSCGDRTHQAWQQQYSASVRGGGDGLLYFASGEYQDIAGNMPNDLLEKWVVRGNFTFEPAQDLQFQWNTAYSNQWQSNTPTGNNAQGLTLNVFRQDQNYFGSGDPDLIDQVLVWEIEQVIERFTSGGTITYSPLANLTNRFTVGYDYTSQENRNHRPFGFVSFPEGGLNNLTYEFRLLTFDYVGTYSFDLTNTIASNFSWGGQAVGADEQELEAWGEGFPGAVEPTVNSASSTLGFESRERTWTAGFFFQNVFDIADRYFITAGMRMDGSSTFGSGFGMQVYPKVSAAWVISDEAWWPESAGVIKLRSAFGKSGRAPGSFDAVKTWSNTGLAGQPAFTPSNVGNPDLGPEITSEIEVGFDGSWAGGRITADYTYYHQTTSEALLDLSQVPSMGFTSSQLTNVGKLQNVGHELAMNFVPFESRNWGVDVGLNVSTNESEVLEWVGGDADQRVGYPIQRNFGEMVMNPDEIGAPVIEEDVYIGPEFPTLFLTPSFTVRMPQGITLSARGEYRGGHVGQVNPISVDRSVSSPLCYPYYQDAATSIALRSDIPALWRARCTPSIAEGYWFDGDYFKLRSVTATVPMDFAFPDRIQSALLTVSLGNAYTWMKDIPWYDPEVLGNQGANSTGLGASERVPPPATLRMSLRVTF